jgi:hypothetical protein
MQRQHQSHAERVLILSRAVHSCVLGGAVASRDGRLDSDPARDGRFVKDFFTSAVPNTSRAHPKRPVWRHEA